MNTLHFNSSYSYHHKRTLKISRLLYPSLYSPLFLALPHTYLNKSYTSSTAMHARSYARYTPYSSHNSNFSYPNFTYKHLPTEIIPASLSSISVQVRHKNDSITYYTLNLQL
jgi:hypothetical protein